MTELSPRARAACEALRAAGASDEERERVRARLSALGVAMSVGAGAALTAGTAASVASASVATGAPSALPATSLAAQAGGQALVGGGVLAGKGALLGAVGASKLVALPFAVKTGLAVIAVSSALVAPKLFSGPSAVPSAATVERAEPGALRVPEPAPRIAPAPKVASPTPVVTALNGAPAQASNAAPRRPISAARAVSDARVEQAESPLAAESALLAEALSALRSGRAGRARELLARHEEIYGAHALLARERERMRRELSHLLR